jgi:2'-5' RNA ligase
MTSRVAFISLEPDESLASLVGEYKRRVRQLTGNQLFLSDPPHTTLYLAAFDQLNRVAKALFNLALGIEPIEITLDGWHVFENDALTGNHTLVCHWSEASQRAARQIQKKVVDRLSPLRNLATTEKRFSSRWTRLTQEQQRSVIEKGFPYTGPAWHPHLTIASIKPSDWEKAFGELRTAPPKITGMAKGLKLYELVGDTPRPILTIPFQTQTVAA